MEEMECLLRHTANKYKKCNLIGVSDDPLGIVKKIKNWAYYQMVNE